MGLNAVTFAISAVLIAIDRRARRRRRAPARDHQLVRGRARGRARARRAARRSATLLGSSTGVVLCIGITNVGEVVLAREVLDVGGTGLAVMVAAGGLGTVLGSLVHPLHHRRRVGLAPRLRARRRRAWRSSSSPAPSCTRSGSSSPRSRSAASATASRSSTTACCSPHSTPEPRCTAASSASRRPASRSPSRSPSCVSGALIATAGVQSAFLVCGRRPGASSWPRASRACARAWPTPATGLGRASLGAHGEIAQLVEHTTENRGVPGSSPGLATRERPCYAGPFSALTP